MTKTAIAILQVLRDLQTVGKITKAIEIRRTRAGYWQLSAGAWSWYAVDDKTGMEVCGSQYTCREVIQAHSEKQVEVYFAPLSCTPELIVTKHKTKGQWDAENLLRREAILRK